ncbi:hypothetical protein M885DRAFT_513310 [Pelagophyceae sp. CCMP2097]|nr:hypothetical protein M885DRAFT_513310 [Pelagophyceae sp. CCMP2097]|mmetsp:Transcript_16564/g.57795  ORF Transcript_16564/g.57795 Transcript_16564/m.57795 type:complete len:826 (+) Transcript_16564:110-2587(+)
MGPKKEKKKKKTKAELEQERLDREKQEEQEEKERQRREAEALELASVAAERKDAAQKACRVAELEALETEEYEQAPANEARRKLFEEAKKKRDSARNWEAYRACSKLPAAESDRELNTYLSQLEDVWGASSGGAQGNGLSLPAALEAILTTERVAACLADARADAAARGDSRAAQRGARFSARLRDATVSQLDRATAGVLLHADEACAASDDRDKKEVFVTGTNVDVSTAAEAEAAEVAATGEALISRMQSQATMVAKSLHASNTDAARSTLAVLQHDAAPVLQQPPAEAVDLGIFHDAVKVGIWANLSIKVLRGPFKQLNFAEIDINVDLPKTLGTQRLGARVVYTPYEHVAPQYRMEAQPPLAGAVAAGLSGGGLVPGEVLEDNLLPAAEMMLLGATVQLEVLELPPAPKEIKAKWSMQEMTSLATTVKVQDFPPGAEHSTLVPLAELRGGAGSNSAPNQYLRCRVRVADHVVVPQQLRVAWWDPARACWLDGTTFGVEYNAVKREVAFNASRSGLLALVQPRTLDVPYSKWSLIPSLPFDARGASEVEEACVRLRLETPRYVVVIEVKSSSNGLCRLLEPAGLPELAPLLAGVELAPGRMLAALSKAGIHIQPTDADAAALERTADAADKAADKAAADAAADAAETADAADDAEAAAPEAAVARPARLPRLKRAGLERKLCDEVSELAAGFDFADYGSALGPDRVALRVRETAAYVGGGDHGGDHDVVLVELDSASKTAREAPGEGTAPGAGIKCALVREVFAGEAFDDAPLPGHDAHLYLRKALSQQASAAAFSRVDRAPLGFQQTVQELLHLTRPFSFCG